jgi:hypothetical protein
MNTTIQLPRILIGSACENLPTVWFEFHGTEAELRETLASVYGDAVTTTVDHFFGAIAYWNGIQKVGEWMNDGPRNIALPAKSIPLNPFC